MPTKTYQADFNGPIVRDILKAQSDFVLNTGYRPIYLEVCKPDVDKMLVNEEYQTINLNNEPLTEGQPVPGLRYLTLKVIEDKKPGYFNLSAEDEK